MKNLNNSLRLTIMFSLFSSTMFASSASNAQPFNTVRAFLAPATQPAVMDFPSAQQVQQALSTPVIQQRSTFSPLQQPPQVFVNQFSTPDAPRARPQFVAPTRPMVNTATMAQRYVQPNHGYSQQAMRFPGVPRSVTNARQPQSQRGFANNPMGNMFPANFGAGNSNPNPFAFPAMPFANNTTSNPMTGWNNNNWGGMGKSFPFMPNTNSNRKKAWGDKRNIWPDFYTDFTDNAWDEAIGGPRKLGRMPGGWRFPYISTPDPVTVSDAVTNQFPPIATEAGHMVDISKWGIFDGK